jgi:hypothetical protein
MASALKAVQHKATALVGKYKHDKGAATYFDPNFGEAQAQLEDLRGHVRDFIKEADQLIRALPLVFKAASEFATLTEKCFGTLPLAEDRSLADHVTRLAENLNSFVTEKTGAAAKDEVIHPLQDLLRRLDDLSNLAKRQTELFLILVQNKAKLEVFQKDPEKNRPKIAEYEAKINDRTLKVNEFEREFIERMNAAWVNRFELLRRPLCALVAIVTETGERLQTAAAPIKDLLGEEALAPDDPVGT